MSKIKDKSNYKFPAISVIIPMYNVEKYVGQCLESLLNQTFQDFEVIVIDDCSTDGSVKVVESFIPKFNGRLNIIRLNKNSGGAGIPRNIGIRTARGKYIAFLDSDDLFVQDALERLYKIAEKYNADVVHMNRYLVPTNGMDSEINSQTKFEIKKPHGDYPSKIEINSSNIDERVKHFINVELAWGIYSIFVRRNLIFENEISFINILAAEDFVFSLSCLCSAKIYVNIPDVLYIYRTREGSITNSGFALNVIICKWIKGLSIGIQELDKFLNKKDFFKNHIEFKYMILDFFFRHHIKWFTSWIYAKYPYAMIDNLVRQELNKIQSDSSFIAHYFNMANIYYLHLDAAQKEIAQLKQQIAILQQKS